MRNGLAVCVIGRAKVPSAAGNKPGWGASPTNCLSIAVMRRDSWLLGMSLAWCAIVAGVLVLVLLVR